jgi:PAS domain S-box-containing protein
MRDETLFQSSAARYAFSIAAVAAAFALKMLLMPWTGSGAPLVFAFAAILVTSVFAGTGPAVVALLITVPLGALVFVLPEGYSGSQALTQASLYLIDGLIIVYLTSLTSRRRVSLQHANHRLLIANEERARAFTRTRETIDLAPDAYFLADLDGHLTDVNQAACRLLAYTREELVRKNLYDIVPPEDIARLAAARADLMVPGRIHKSEWLLRRKDGRFVPVEASANILREGRWQAFVRDISAARRITREREEQLAREQLARLETELANAHLRESEERFRLAFEETPIGAALVSLDGRFVRVNQVLSEITGYAVDELTGLAVHQVTHPDDVDKDRELLAKLNGGEIRRYQIEKHYIRKDRAIVVIMLSVSLLRAPDGAPQYYIVRIEDITDRKRAEEALRFSEAKFSGIVSIAADAIISVDMDQRILIFNEGAEKIFGYTMKEMVGTPLESLIAERFRAAHREHFTAFLDGTESSRSMAERREIFGRRKNGEEFPAEASISKVVVNNSTFLSVVLRDVTYRKSVEEALRRAVTARDEVLGIVAHDLRNPLSTIMMQTEMLERADGQAERRDQTPRLVILRSAQRMNRLIQDLLDVAVVEGGQLLWVARERQSVADLVRDAAEMQRPLAKRAGMELTVDVERDLPELSIDRDRLLQVFGNLVGNALKFTPMGGYISVRAMLKDRNVLFSVADSGSGIAPENVPHVFDRFWQASKRAGRLGAGLGLPITKGIIEAHGGRVWVESAIGRGTTFFFTIPIAAPDASIARPRTHPDALRTLRRPRPEKNRS